MTDPPPPGTLPPEDAAVPGIDEAKIAGIVIVLNGMMNVVAGMAPLPEIPGRQYPFLMLVTGLLGTAIGAAVWRGSRNWRLMVIAIIIVGSPVLVGLSLCQMDLVGAVMQSFFSIALLGLLAGSPSKARILASSLVAGACLLDRFLGLLIVLWDAGSGEFGG